MLAVLLAGFWFGGASSAVDCNDDAVACINEAWYTTVAAAITAYEWNGEILIKKTNWAEESLTTNKDVTLNLNGNTINACVTVNGWTLTIKDKDDNSWKIVCSSYIMQVEAGTLKMYGWTYENGVDVWVKSAEAKAEIYDWIYRSVAWNTAAVWAYNWWIIDIHGWTFRWEINPPKNWKCFWAWGGQVAGDTHWIVNIDWGDFDGRISASEGSEYHISGWSFAGTGVAKTAVCSEFDWWNNDQEWCMETDLDAYLVAGYVVSFEGGKYVVKQASRFSQIQHDADVTAPGTSTDATYSVSEDGYTMTVSGKIAFDAVHWEVNRYGIAVTTVAAWDKNWEFSGAIVYLKKAGTDDYVEAGNFWTLYEEYPDYNPWLYWYPAVTKRNQTDYLKIVWAEGIEEIYTINVENAILDLPEDEEVSQNDADTETAALESELVIPTYDTEETDESKMFTVTIGTWDYAVVYEWIPVSKVALSEDGNVNASDVATNATIEGKIEISFGSGKNAYFSKPLGIKIKTNKNAKIKVKHAWDSTYSIAWLTANPNATCTNWVASDPYDWSERAVDWSGFVTIYTCAASEFVAYTEPTPSSSSPSWGGGSSSSSYSCKSLPANAVANNTTKPKKNTYYSYSTDTGAVCTFQCKDGYAWNEKDSKCEKADETVADTETNKDETTATENTENADTSDAAATEDLQKVLEDGYNVEFHKAYEFAFQNGITTMPTIEEADMNGNLNRIAMAKMLSQYAINILGKTPDTTREVPNFPDVDAQLDADYNNGVTLAYQLGIMWINIDEFRPFDLVTRAEFGTALSRMLFGLADGEGDAYYSTHLEKLMSEWIITNDDPRLDELRGYVMIMLMRSASK